MSNIKTIPMLKICTPPPDMYSIKACIGNDLAGPVENSHARFTLISSNWSLVFEAVDEEVDDFLGFCWIEETIRNVKN